MKKLLESLKAYKERRARTRSAKSRIEFASHFQVKERNSRLYLVIDDVAFAVVDGTATADDIASLLTDARNASLNYRES
jgi:hypothetical protein